MENILEKIYNTGLKFLVPLTAEETYATIAREAVRLFKADYGSIFLEKKGVFERVYPQSDTVYKMKMQKRSFISSAFKTGIPVIASVEKVEKIYPQIKDMGIKSIVSIPISYRNKTIGVLTIQSAKENYFSDKDLNALKLFGPIASLAIRKTQLYVEAQKALKTRDLFISLAAHELRTPLTTVHGYVQLLRTIFSENSTNGPAGRWLKELSWELVRLTQLVNELLEVSRVNTGKMHFVWREHHLTEIVNRAILDFRFNYPDRKLIFKNQTSNDKDMMVGDFDKLLQVIINFLDNAAKFSPKDQQVFLSLRYKASHVILTVADKGRGIAKKDMPKIFESFYKVDNNLKEGMGLGLFLAKNIIEQHHGSIYVHSQVDKGTQIEMRLPQVRRVRSKRR